MGNFFSIISATMAMNDWRTIIVYVVQQEKFSIARQKNMSETRKIGFRKIVHSEKRIRKNFM